MSGPLTFTVWGFPAGLADDWGMDFGGPIESKSAARLVADGLFADARLYGRKLRRVVVVDRDGKVVHEKKRRRR